MPRAELSADQIAELIAKEFGVDVENMSYQWDVDCTGEFKGVLLFDSVVRRINAKANHR